MCPRCLEPPCPSSLSHPAVLSQSAQLSPLGYAAVCCWLCFTHGGVYLSVLLLSVHPTRSFPCCVHKPVLHVCISSPALKIDHQYHFSRFHIYALIYVFVFLFLTYFTLCNRLWFIRLWHCLKLDAVFQPRSTNTVEILSLVSVLNHIFNFL